MIFHSVETVVAPNSLPTGSLQYQGLQVDYSKYNMYVLQYSGGGGEVEAFYVEPVRKPLLAPRIIITNDFPTKAEKKNRQSRRSIKPYSAPFLLLKDNIVVPLGD
jgi:hypothetical protein